MSDVRSRLEESLKQMRDIREGRAVRRSWAEFRDSETTAATFRPIALTGLLRSGKDSVADYLVDKYGYTRFAFGDGIKRITRELYPEAYAGNTKPRALLQGFGEAARQFDPNVWVNDCFRRIGREGSAYFRGRLQGIDARNGDVMFDFPASPFRPVISDLRLPNEYDRCRAERYVIIRVNCPDEIRIERAQDAGDSFTVGDLRHETEQHVDTFAVDYDVDNGGTLDELYAQIDDVMAELSRYSSAKNTSQPSSSASNA